MKRYYLTFGQQNPQRDGYILVMAVSYEDARAKVIEVYGIKWSGLYAEKDFANEYFPKGQLGVLKA
jgi:hypothetical protein